jgi:hypothetical protein
MTDEDVSKLKTAVAAYKAGVGPKVMWVPDDQTSREVVGFKDELPEEQYGDNWEPGPVAIFSGVGIGKGAFVALDNCEISEFARVERFS